MQGLRRCPQVLKGVSGHPSALPGGIPGCRAGAATPRAETLTAGLGHPLGLCACTSRVSAASPGGLVQPRDILPQRAVHSAGSGALAGLCTSECEVTCLGVCTDNCCCLAPGGERKWRGSRQVHTDGLGSDPGKKPSGVYESPGRALATVSGADLSRISPYGTWGSAVECAGLAPPWSAQVLALALAVLDQRRCRAGLRGQRGLRSYALGELRPWTGPRV